MHRGVTRRTSKPGFESLEGRALLSSAGVLPYTAAGLELSTLIKLETHDMTGLIHKFGSASPVEARLPGMAVKTPSFQPLYTGLTFESLNLVTAGAVLLKGNKLELGAIAQGPFSQSGETSRVVFAINRGAGSALGPTFASRPGITPDLLVSITVGPHASSHSGTITDLTTGATHEIRQNEIQVKGATVRVFLGTSQIPSKGLPVKKYTFAAWTEVLPYTGINSVGSFAPDGSMIPIGVETNVSPPRL
jgi:hypothetical protein